MNIESVLADTLILSSSSNCIVKEDGKKADIGKTYSGKAWSFERFFDIGPCVRNMVCSATEHPTSVCNLIKWISPIRISFDLHTGQRLTQIEFPLDCEYIVSDMTLISPGVIKDSKWWLDDLSIDCGFQLVFGYEISGCDATPTPLKKPETRDYCDFYDDRIVRNVISVTELSGNMSAISITRPRFLICISLVGCNPDSRFEPEGLIEAARFFPVAMIKANHGIAKISKIHAEIHVSRHSELDHVHSGMTKNRTIYLIADRNSKNPETGIINEGILDTPAPFWEAIFDYYKEWIGQENIDQGFIITDATQKKIRKDRVHRRILNTSTLNPTDQPVDLFLDPEIPYREPQYIHSEVVKLPYQGEYDNIHISPTMMSDHGEVIMAPICQHDCLHTHFRWGNGYNDVKWVRGWDENKPFSKIGAPLAPLNQIIRTQIFRNPESIGFKYHCEIFDHDPRSWVFIYHHGSCCAVKINENAITSKMNLLTRLKNFMGKHLLDVTPGNANFYYLLRYAAFSNTPRIDENKSNFYFLQKL